ncbi:hypothetical protein L3Q82_000136 [Scortum barcoo]|uniref:Uncharacterized protein n=1 Tax=Scortum barcoo TaxID=214431 RepID=A0ACB8X9A9_9TELE|nr:hypothetical protein L3Q82_000136 [Scortum barcoo]
MRRAEATFARHSQGDLRAEWLQSSSPSCCSLSSTTSKQKNMRLKRKADSLTFNLTEEADFCLISRFVDEEKLVLWNTSDLWTKNSTVPEDLKQRLLFFNWTHFSFYIIHSLTHSDSGQYQEECWTEGKVTYENNIRITVCSTIYESKVIHVTLGGEVDIPCEGAADNLDIMWIKIKREHIKSRAPESPITARCGVGIRAQTDRASCRMCSSSSLCFWSSSGLPVYSWKDGCWKNGSALASARSSIRLTSDQKMSVCVEEEEDRSESAGSSCLSMKSDRSKELPPAEFSNEPGPSDTNDKEMSSQREEEESCFCEGAAVLLCFVSGRPEWIQSLPAVDTGSADSASPHTGTSLLHQETPPVPSVEERSRTRAGLQTASQTSSVQRTDEAGSGTLLNRIYTDLYITEGQSEEVNTQHEVRQLEKTSKMKIIHETPIKCHNIFKALADQQKHIRVVLMNGVAGVGKTFSVQKFTLDWAEGLENQDKVTAEQLAVCKLLFIFDGLDESRLSLDFYNSEVVSDVTQKSSVNVLLTNLIKGNLLPSALVWITSRPAAANQIPPEYVDRLTEVRGFTDAQKEEYFRRRFSDEDLSSRIISHIKTSRTLHIMCQIPVFCWIAATVLDHMLTTDQRGELPKTLTDLYSHFLLVQIKRKKQKYDEGHERRVHRS